MPSMLAAPAILPGLYFDGLQGKGHVVELHLDGMQLRIIGDGIDRSEALRSLQWPERTRHGTRIAHLNGGGSVQSADSAAWDAWCQAAGVHDTLIARLQQSWRGVAASVLVLVILIVGLQQWGIPLAARAALALIPRTVDAAIGDYTQGVVDAQLMEPSKLPASQAQQIREALTRAVASMPAGSVPQWQLLLRSSKLGPNALALPNGSIILTDEMVHMVDGSEDVLVGVLAHELGHVQQRHGMRMLVQVTALGAIASTVWGDFSSLLAGVPMLMGQASYSREAEQEADTFAVDVLRHAHLSPTVMVTMFDKLAEWRVRKAQEEHDKAAGKPSDNAGAKSAAKASSKDAAGKESDSDALDWLGIAFASHPADAQRVLFFQEAARNPVR
ncbi:MAG: M48 family metallopeptidase [Pseudomonadota bacterium]